MKRYEIRLVKKHLLFDCDGHTYMVDTGSPFTFTREGSTMMMPGMPDPIEYLDNASSFVGEKIDAMIGIDVLRNFRVVIDYWNHTLELYDAQENPGIVLEEQCTLLVSPDKHIGMEAVVNGHSVRLAVDTGACIQYIAKEISAGEPVCGEAKDYHELTGQFTTPLYSLETQIGCEFSQLEFGNLPDQLMFGLTMSNFQGVVGFDFFKDHKVMLDFVNCQMSWSLHDKNRFLTSTEVVSRVSSHNPKLVFVKGNVFSKELSDQLELDACCPFCRAGGFNGTAFGLNHMDHHGLNFHPFIYQHNIPVDDFGKVVKKHLNAMVHAGLTRFSICPLIASDVPGPDADKALVKAVYDWLETESASKIDQLFLIDFSGSTNMVDRNL